MGVLLFASNSRLFDTKSSCYRYYKFMSLYIVKESVSRKLKPINLNPF